MWLFEWEQDREAASFLFVLDRYIPMVGFDDSFRDCKAKPSSLVVRGTRRLTTKGDIEDSLDVGFGYTPA